MDIQKHFDNSRNMEWNPEDYSLIKELDKHKISSLKYTEKNCLLAKNIIKKDLDFSLRETSIINRQKILKNFDFSYFSCCRKI